MNNKRVLHKSLKIFKSATKSPEMYLVLQNAKAEKTKNLVKNLYDYAITKENDLYKSIPNELCLEDMDEEQIWQQIELQNDALWSRCLHQTSKLLSLKDEHLVLKYNREGVDSDSYSDDKTDIEEESANGAIDNEDFSEDDELDTEDEEKDKKTSKPPKKIGRTSIVDDKFFKLSEMEEYLVMEDKKEMQKHNRKQTDDSDDDIDYFNGDFSEDNEDEDDQVTAEKHAKYLNFFDHDSFDESEDDQRMRRKNRRESKNKESMKRKKKDLGLEESDIDEDANEGDIEEDDENRKSKVKFDMSRNIFKSDSDDEQSGDSEDKKIKQFENEDGEKSSYEHRQERLRNQIKNLETAALGEKSWQLKGEIDSTSRPQNSLLEEILKFDTTTRPALIITEETTLKLEDIIKQRIKDRAWNDVELKFKPVHTPQEFRKKLILNQEKSKESLAQIYEKEYLKEIEKINPHTEDKVEEEPMEHTEIRKLMKSLFVQLDALSNFYFTPKPVVPEVKIITNLPAVNMEEVGPIATSNAELLAAEEIKPRSKGDIIGKSERSKTDKKRERRQKKLKQKFIKIAKEKKNIEKQKLGIKSSGKEEEKNLLSKVTKSRNVQKMKESNDVKSFKSSKAFFSKLQDDVSTKVKRKTKENGEQIAKKFKL